MNKEEAKYIFWGIVILLLILSYFILRPFLVSLISAFVLAYLTKPIYNKLSRKISKYLSAFICILIVIIIVILPLGTITAGIITQANFSLSQNTFSDFLEKVSTSPLLQSLNIDLEAIKVKIISFVIQLITSAVSYLPFFLLSVFVTLFAMYYILIDWEYLSANLKQFIPFKEKDKTIEEIDRSTKGIIYGMFLIAIIEFIIAFIGFFFSGVKFYLLLPALIFFLAFVPGLGPAAVWVPTAIFYIFAGNYAIAIGVIITGLVLTIGIDTFLINKITSKKSQINPVIMLLGIIGGIAVFGIFGFIIGPLVLAYTIKLVQEGIKQV